MPSQALLHRAKVGAAGRHLSFLATFCMGLFHHLTPSFLSFLCAAFHLSMGLEQSEFIDNRDLLRTFTFFPLRMFFYGVMIAVGMDTKGEENGLGMVTTRRARHRREQIVCFFIPE